jgi:hypothetical protein
MIRLTLKYLDACASDYFQGFSGLTFAVNCEGKPRNHQILSDLLREISGSELYGLHAGRGEETLMVEDFVSASQGQGPTDIKGGFDGAYEQLRSSAHELFNDCDGRKRFGEYGEGCYVYFGVLVDIEPHVEGVTLKAA